MAAALAYVHWHTLKTTVPELLKGFHDELSAERAQHDRHILLLLGRLENVEEGLAQVLVRLDREGGRS